jgi:hypothetical protein
LKRAPKFASEEQLCEAFTKWAQKEGWTVYPESCGFDLLLVNADGHQLGIEAKLSLNMKVIQQIMPLDFALYGVIRGPHHRAILVPEAHNEDALVHLLKHAGIEVFSLDYRGEFQSASRSPYLFDRNPEKTCSLPEYMPDVPAGVSGPVKLTKWKVAALRIMATLELNGEVTKADFVKYKLDPRRWISADGWLTPIGKGVWVIGKCPRFDEQHPIVFAQIMGELRASRERVAA